MIYRKMPDKTLDTYLHVKHSADKMAGSTDFSALAALALGRLNEFLEDCFECVFEWIE